jgi:hypothetical protein
VLRVAQARLREQQDAMAEYRRSAQNVRGQIALAGREQEMTLRETLDAIGAAFAEVLSRGREALAEVFSWANALGLALGGIAELTGLARFFRRLGRRGVAEAAFQKYQVYAPLERLPELAERLGPRLEGRDVKDTDDLILYTRREIDRLPGLNERVIGKLDVPVGYDRGAMQAIRPQLSAALERARKEEFARVDEAVRGTISILAVYELAVLVIGILLFAAGGGDGGTSALLLVVVLLMLLGGLAVMPLRGLLMQRRFSEQLGAIRTEYEGALAKAAMSQIAYGTQMRQDAVGPFLRVVEAQEAQANTVGAALAEHDKALTALEGELGTLR